MFPTFSILTNTFENIISEHAMIAPSTFKGSGVRLKGPTERVETVGRTSSKLCADKIKARSSKTRWS